MFCTTRGRRYLCPLATLMILRIALSYGVGIESISIDENSPTYIDISWGIEAGSSWDYYSVDVITAGRSNVNGYPTNTTEMSHRITGLRPDTEYTVTVTPWTIEGSGNSLNETITTEAIAEGEILVSDVKSLSAFLQWMPVDGVSFYTIVAEPSDAIEASGGIFEAEVELTILLPGTVFNVTVQGGSMDLASTQIRSAPEVPVNVSLGQIGVSEASLLWTPPNSPHGGYEIYVTNNSTKQRSLFATLQREDVIEHDFTLTGLSRATSYMFEVGTVLNATGSFELQRSDQDKNPSVLGRTEAIAEGEVLVFNVTSSSALIRWKPRDGNLSYTIVAEPSAAIGTSGDIFESEVALTILLPGTVFNVTVRGGSMDLASTQIRSGPEPPVSITVTGNGEDYVNVTLAPPTSRHDEYELYLFNSTTNQKSLVMTVQREDDTNYDWTVSGLSPSTHYTVEVGTVLDAEGLFPLQRSEDNPMTMFQTDPPQLQTGDAVFPTLHYVLFLMPLIALFSA